jgi:small subunit ribosomal protein S1
MENEAASTLSSITDVKRKMHLSGTVVKTTLQGAILNIGLEVPGVVHISQLQKDPVNRVEDVVQVGQTVETWVRRVPPEKDRVELTMVKPLDLEWRDLKKDMVVKGKVTRLEKFGAFVDIGAERPGLIHISELTHDYIKDVNDVVKEGDEVEVKILEIDRKKKQIKLSRKALEERVVKPPVKAVQKEKEAEQEEAPEAPIPTAMEAALREAMDRAKTRKESEPKVKAKPKTHKPQQELESILSRTLEQKVRSTSKN